MFGRSAAAAPGKVLLLGKVLLYRSGRFRFPVILLLQPFMKTTVLTLLAAVLLVSIANLLVSLGLFGGAGGRGGEEAGHDYKALSPEQMDDIGFRAVATEEGIAIGEDGKITFPKDKVEKIAKVNLLPRTILEVEKDGGWEFVAVTADNHYLFRRAK